MRSRHPHIVNWDDAESIRREAGEMGGTWTLLGEAVGTVGVGLRRIVIDPGRRSTPVHRHGGEEEIFYVLGGSGLSWQDGRAYEVRPGDGLVHLAGAEAHTLAAGEDGLDVLAFGTRSPAVLSDLPRAGVAWAPPTWVRTGGEHPWEAEAAAGPLEWPAPDPERPATIVALVDAAVRERHHGRHERVAHDLGRSAGSRISGLQHVEVPAGRRGVPLHCHSTEEEVFVVLEGTGVLELGDEEHPVARGDVIARPPGTGVAHALRAADDGPLTYLAYGTREPNDIAYYPRSNKVAFRGIGLMGRIERLDYWDGED
jgi:uncharacterized cupin superfamily protein